MALAGKKSIKSSTYKPDFRPVTVEKLVPNEALGGSYESAL
jgi:hypothetical protein